MTNREVMIIFTAIMKRMIDNFPSQFALEMGIGDIDDILELNKIVIEALEKQAASEWIPVSERLPEDLVAVNVTWINRCPENYYMHIKDKPFTDTAILYKGEWYWWDSTIIDYLSEFGTCISGIVDKSIDILAWRPLPEPYKGE